MELIAPSATYEESWLKAIKEFEEEGYKGFWNWFETPADINMYIQKCKNNAEGMHLHNGWVPSTTFWLVDKGIFIGHGNIRHKLNDHLLKIGGHIGYAIRSSERGKGYGSKMLELLLPEARKIGITKALVTCDNTNLPSKKIIENNNGEFEDSYLGEDGITKLRYWIEL